jgi:hypothetical protein
MSDVGTVCPNCGEMFVLRKPEQKFCSRKCQIAVYNAKRRSASPKTAQRREKGREAKDGLRCRTCGEFIDNREGWRLDCKSCSRTKMKALHNSVTCTRKSCVICMERTVAQSPEFVAVWEEDAA